MGEMAVKSTGLLSKISSLFNNKLFSDLKFIFTSDTGQIEVLYAHKLILALRSKVFNYMFFEQEESTCEITLTASKKPVFELLLRFLYTDDVQFQTTEEAQNLYYLVMEYEIEELGQKCYNYILQDGVTIANIFRKYQCALETNIEKLLKNCRDFVCSVTEQVLSSDQFTSASSAVIEDIIKQDNLSLSSELQVITAVLKWGTEDLERNKMPCNEKNLRNHINKFMKHLRFLTLSSSEFDNFVDEHNILTAKESSLLTRKILQPESNIIFPEDICCITSKRKVSHFNNTFSTVDANLPTIRPLLQYQSKSTKATPPKPEIPCSKSELSDFEVPSSSKISYEVKKCSSIKEHRLLTSQLRHTKLFPSPAMTRSLSHFSPVVQNSPVEYSFPLYEIKQSCLGLSFQKDICSSVVFKMKSGNICLRGFELNIKNYKNDDNLKVFVHVTGFSPGTSSNSYEEKICNNILPIMLKEPMILKEGNKGTLQVRIENLFLNRCSAINYVGKPYELNNGLDFGAEFCLNSNQTNDGFLFLIHKLLYTRV